MSDWKYMKKNSPFVANPCFGFFFFSSGGLHSRDIRKMMCQQTAGDGVNGRQKWQIMKGKTIRRLCPRIFFFCFFRLPRYSVAVSLSCLFANKAEIKNRWSSSLGTAREIVQAWRWAPLRRMVLICDCVRTEWVAVSPGLKATNKTGAGGFFPQMAVSGRLALCTARWLNMKWNEASFEKPLVLVLVSATQLQGWDEAVSLQLRGCLWV